MKYLYFLLFIITLSSCETKFSGFNNNNNYHIHHWKKHNSLDPDNGYMIQFDCVYENCDAWGRKTKGEWKIIKTNNDKLIYERY